MPRIQAHTHKLKRHTYKSTGHSVFFCVLDCSFKVDVGLALGKKTICWRCGTETPINEYSIRLARPICMSCKKVKNPEVKELTHEVLVSAAETPANDLKDRLSKALQFQARPDEDI